MLAKRHFKVPFFKSLKLNVLGGYTADQYALYDLDNNSKEDYLSEFDWYRSRYINEPFNPMLNNKIICNDMLKPYVRVPEIYLIKVNKKLSSYSFTINTYEETLELIKKAGKVIIKPISAGKGKGVHIVSYEGQGFQKDNSPIGEKELMKILKKEDNWFISEYLHQDKYSNSLYKETANTIRLITIKDLETGRFKVLFAVQRIGTSGTIPVDNGSKGALVANINLGNGELSEARSLHSLDVHWVHPDSNAAIKGERVPNWDKIKRDIVALASKFPYLNFIAWDILLTEEGMAIIEANTSSGVNIIQLWGGQRHGPLGDFYRHYNIIR